MRPVLMSRITDAPQTLALWLGVSYVENGFWRKNGTVEDAGGGHAADCEAGCGADIDAGAGNDDGG